jgi:hypothetical protein
MFQPTEMAETSNGLGTNWDHRETARSRAGTKRERPGRAQGPTNHVCHIPPATV